MLNWRLFAEIICNMFCKFQELLKLVSSYFDKYPESTKSMHLLLLLLLSALKLTWIFAQWYKINNKNDFAAGFLNKFDEITKWIVKVCKNVMDWIIVPFLKYQTNLWGCAFKILQLLGNLLLKLLNVMGLIWFTLSETGDAIFKLLMSHAYQNFCYSWTCE